MKVIGVGDNVVDDYTHIRTLFPGGNALNFAVFARKMGIESAYLGPLAKDTPGDHLVKTLMELNVDLSQCPREEGETGCPKVKLVDGDRVFMGSNKGGVCSTARLELTGKQLRYIEDYDFVFSSCYSFLEDQVPLLAKHSKRFGFDFSTRTESDYLRKIAPYLDMAIISGSHLSQSDCDEKLKEIADLGVQKILITRGSKPSLFQENTNRYIGTVKEINPVDTLGAGDTYLTRLIVELLKCGWVNIEKEQVQIALEKAAEDAALTCEYYGAFGHGLLY